MDAVKRMADAVRTGAELLHHQDEFYAARWDGTVWWVYSLSTPGSTEYAVDELATRCTCPGFQEYGRCKHLMMFRQPKGRPHP